MPRAIVFFTGVILALLWAGILFVTSEDRERTIAAAVSVNESLARAHDEHVAAAIGGLDHLAQLVRLQLVNTGGRLDLSRLLRDIAVPPSVLQVAIIDRDGYVTHSSLPFERIDLSDREHFRVHRDADTGTLFISKPVLGRVSGKWSLQLSRRINGSGGAFAGVVVVSVDSNYFADIYADVNHGSNRAVTFIGLDGIVRARRMGDETTHGADVREAAVFQRLRTQPRGSILMPSAFDGVTRYVSYRTMQRYPLVVVVAESEAEVLKPFVARQRYLVVAASAVTLLILGTAAWLVTLAHRESRHARELENSRARLRAFMDSVPDCGWMKDREGRFVAVNQSFAERCGMAARELIGKTDYDLFHPKLAERFREHDALVMQTGQTLSFEARLETNGEARLFEANKAPVYDAGNNVCGVSAIARDVTERKRAELALVESERRLNLALEGAGLVMFDWNIATGEVNLTERWSVLLGGDEQPTCTTLQALAALVHPDDVAALDAKVIAALKHDGLYRAEHRVRRTDGEWVWIESHGCVVMRDADGRALRMLGINRDITQRKSAEIALSDAYAFVDSVLENIPVMVCVKDVTDMRFVRVNKAGEDLLGYRRDELIGETGKDVLPDWYSALFGRAGREALARRSLVQIPEAEITTRDGAVRCVAVKKLPILDARGECRYVLSIGEDITERRRAETAARDMHRMLAQRADELAAAHRELDAYTYTVSHDLHGPLRHISGFTRLLRERLAGSADAHAQRLFDNVDRATWRMGQLIDDLLAFSRTNRTELRKEPVALDALVADVVQELAAEAGDRNIEWITGSLPVVHGDYNLIRLALNNVVGNAVKYTRRRRDARIEIGSAARSEGKVVVYVRDNGIGFDPKDAERVFGVFERLHDGREFEGTGIGLATVKRIIERHGGRVWGQGEPGVGATFYLALPACSDGGSIQERAA